MNQRFYSLPEEKQQAILNAGYRVFSQNSYKKSPMSEIAGAAGISKSLLFHYFTNKKDLYLFLWEKSREISAQYLEEYGSYEEDDLFEAMLSGLKAKAEIMRKYPDIASFVIKAYYEKDEEIRREIRAMTDGYTNHRQNTACLPIDPSRFKPGLDLGLMYREMIWASTGYLWEKVQGGGVDPDEMERDFAALIQFWKKIYQREEE